MYANIEQHLAMAMQGDAAAQNALGFMYANGQGVPRDFAQAIAWYRKAAEQGHAEAQYNIGVMYGIGRGVPQDFAQAIAWYHKSAEQGYAAAQFNLGMMYSDGHGVPKDDAQAFDWYHKAAKQGIAKAQYNIGVMYNFGWFVPQIFPKAMEWYKKAASQGYPAALNNIGTMHEFERGIERNLVLAYAFYCIASSLNDDKAPISMMRVQAELTSLQIAEGQRLSSNWAVGQPLPSKAATWKKPTPATLKEVNMVLMAVRAIIYALVFLSDVSVSAKAVVISLLFYFNAYCVANDNLLVNAFDKVLEDLSTYFTWLSSKFNNNNCLLEEFLKENSRSKELRKSLVGGMDFEKMLVYASMAAEIVVIVAAYGIHRLVLSSNIFNIVGLLRSV